MESKPTQASGTMWGAPSMRQLQGSPTVETPTAAVTQTKRKKDKGGRQSQWVPHHNSTNPLPTHPHCVYSNASSNVDTSQRNHVEGSVWTTQSNVRHHFFRLFCFAQRVDFGR
jgi:hypothetical protein